MRSLTPLTRLAVAATASLAMLVAGCSSDSTSDEARSDEPAPTALPGDDLRMNEIQMVGSHNSYHLPAVDEIGSTLQDLVPELWATISYEHRPLAEQLEDYGIRQFELDVFADPEGGEYANPGGYQLVGITLPDADVAVLSEPGFKVAHIADIDRNTTCLTFVACISEIESWSAANPDHLPINVMVETKGDDLREGDDSFGIDVDSLGAEFSRPPGMTAGLFDDLEAEVLEVFDREDLITPDDVRGDADTLESAVLTDGWPTIGATRGKVLFSLVDTGAARDLYVSDAPNLEGRLFFTSSEPGRPDAAFVRVDDPIDDGDRLQELATAGYLIRTRTDSPGIHAPAGDVALRESAMSSGAHYLSTDYYVAHPDTDYAVMLPDGAVARCNPVTAPADCERVTEG